MSSKRKSWSVRKFLRGVNDCGVLAAIGARVHVGRHKVTGRIKTVSSYVKISDGSEVVRADATWWREEARKGGLRPIYGGEEMAAHLKALKTVYEVIGQTIDKIQGAIQESEVQEKLRAKAPKKADEKRPL